MCTVLANAKSTYMHASLLFRETSVRRGRNIYWYRSVSQQYYKYRMQVSCCCQTHFMHVRMAFFHFYFPPRRNLERFTRPQFATKEPKEKKILKFRASCHLASRQSKVFSILVSDCTRNAPTQIILPILKPAISKL